VLIYVLRIHPREVIVDESDALYQMSEEELAAELGLRQTRCMKVVRWAVLKLASRSSAEPSYLFVKALSYYQKLGEKLVDAKPGPSDIFVRVLGYYRKPGEKVLESETRVYPRISAQIGLILLSASIRRDIARFNPHYADFWAEDLNDALTYAENAPPFGLAFDVVEAIEQLIAAGSTPRNN